MTSRSRGTPAPSRPAVISVDDQIKGVQRAHEVLAHQHGILIQRDEMSADHSERLLGSLKMAIRSLEWLAKNRDVIHEVARRLTYTQAEYEAFMAEPAVRAVLEAFPGARILSITEPAKSGATAEGATDDAGTERTGEMEEVD